MKEILHTLVSNTLRELFGISDTSFVIEHPGDMSHGDYATNVALSVSKQLGKNPKEVAETLIEHLNSKKPDFVTTISIAGPGFINFTLARTFFTTALQEAVSVSNWGNNNLHTGKNIVVEHSSPNLFKPFHVGHLMNNTVGEALVRFAKASGATVTSLSFPSDISLGVAKAVFIILEKHGPHFEPTDVQTLGDAYVEGTKRYDEDESIHDRVKEIANHLYANTPSDEVSVFERCKKFNIEYFERIVAKLGSHFDFYIYESEAGVVGKSLVLRHVPGIFSESEGAIVYIPKEETKLHTSVFINSQNNPTYEAKDLGLLEMKFSEYNPDISIVITDNQQISHFNVVLDAAGKIDPVWKQNSVHRSHGRMSFKGQKMSSRLGGVPLVEDILENVVEEVAVKNPDITSEAAEIIGIASLKFVILRAMAGKDINFDPDTSLGFEGDSGPYLQYTTVRAGSVLSKGEEAGIIPSAEKPVEDTITLERLVARFPDIVMRATSEWAPHHVVGYLLELAQSFNSWYGQNKIIGEDREESAYRLLVTHAVSQTITNGLHILGIKVPEKM
jgi:arginyl-tRNA synthetase